MNKSALYKTIQGWISSPIPYVVISAILLGACGVMSGGGNISVDPGIIDTQVADVINAEATRSAGVTAVAMLTQMAQNPPTDTSAPTATQAPTDMPPTATPTSVPSTETQVPPTATSVPPTATSAPPTPTKNPLRCDWAQFVSDVRVKDGDTFLPDEKFTKTWRLKNIGSCTWTMDYSLVFSSGTTMDGPERVRLTENVPPGDTIDLSVNLIAPSKDGSFTGKWMLRNANGVNFGLGSKADQEFWVKINVKKPGQVYYDFSKDYCSAAWSSGSVTGMACPTLPDMDANPPSGAFTHDDAPKMETGGTDDERALIMIPNDGENGVISAAYPAIRIKSGDHFKSVIGCMYHRWNCSVTFRLRYQTGGELHDLGNWSQMHDGEITKIDLDLSSLADKDVSFILTVYNNGSNIDDWAFWLLPRIIR